MTAWRPYDIHRIKHIRRVDHPESIAVGPKGEAYACGTGGQGYRLQVETNEAEQFASLGRLRRAE